MHSIEIPPNSHLDIKALLENGEARIVADLEGGIPCSIIEVDGVGKAFFRHDEPISGSLVRSDLEIFAAEVDTLLGFNLIPPVVKKEVNGKTGALQQFVGSHEVLSPAITHGWVDMIEEEELIRA